MELKLDRSNSVRNTAAEILDPLPDGVADTFYPEKLGPRPQPRDLDSELTALKDAVLALKKLDAKPLARAMAYLNARFGK